MRVNEREWNSMMVYEYYMMAYECILAPMLMVYENIWWYMKVNGSKWYLYEREWSYIMVYECTYESKWMYMSQYDGIWKYMIVL